MPTLKDWMCKTVGISLDHKTPAQVRCSTYWNIIQGTRAVHKNNSVSGRLAGWLKKVRLEKRKKSFLQKKKKSPKMDNIFIEKKRKVEKKKKLRPPDWLQF